MLLVNILLHNSAFFKYLYNIDSTKTPIFIKIEKAHSRTVFGRLHQPTSSCGRILSSYDIFCITENPIRISYYTKSFQHHLPALEAKSFNSDLLFSLIILLMKLAFLPEQLLSSALLYGSSYCYQIQR